MVAVSFVEQTSSPHALKLATFTASGAKVHTAQFGASALDAPDPAIAPLPDGTFAAAWTDFETDGDELGIQLARVDPSVGAEATFVPSERTSFSQSAPDIVFDGRELVLAWVDTSNPITAPDLRYRLFGQDLKPLSDELTLAATNAVEDNVALAARAGQWAAAWRSGNGGLETIEVQSGSTHWTVGPFLPGLDGDRPDLVFLDEAHLALAFTKGTDPDASGVANVSRLHGAILDAKAPGSTASFEIPPAQDPYSSMPDVSQTQPSLALLPGRLLVAWHSAAVPGEARGEELWLRRIPFIVSGDQTITVDASHVEVPLISSSAQRGGDQSAFRMLGTNLWPSGGLVAAWDDQNRTFASSGAPDVGAQFFPDIAEPPPAIGQYPVSADGKYYLVNLLKRNYPGPTANALYSNGATVNNFDPPSELWDGTSYPYAWSTPTANDPDATAVATIDMGRYFDVGAVRTFYANPQALPAAHQISLSPDMASWQTVVPTQAAATDATYSFDHVSARFLRLTQVGSPASKVVGLSELFVFPSTNSASPIAADGYDLGSLATSIANANMWAPGVKQPANWPAGSFQPKVIAEGATGDAVGVVDLGAQYPVSRTSICFFNPFTWPSGGRVDIAPIPNAYQTVFDSGYGQPFASPNTCEDLVFAPKPTRYIRATDYFIPGSGPSFGPLTGILSFTTPAPRTAYYPLSPDGTYFNVNLLRRPLNVVQPSATVVYSGGATQYPSAGVRDPNFIFDGDDQRFEWVAPAANSATATVTITMDLGRVETFGAVAPSLLFPFGSYTLRGALSPGAWFPVLTSTTLLPDASYILSLGTAVQARYLELTVAGMPSNVGGISEFAIYPPATQNPAPSSDSQLNLVTLNGVTVKCGSNIVAQGSPWVYVGNYYYGYPPAQGGGGPFCHGMTAAQGATGDGTITYDLGQIYQISQIGVPVVAGNVLSGGAKVEVDDGSGNWFTVYDSGHGNPFGIAVGTQAITFAKRGARYVRFTNYFTPGVGTSAGFFLNLEVY